ncbi:unnamed protein product [Vitrella brassicaformis CCMP3155]|uniref:Uncharacterized protein n=1 Tax=Vitrella brassicaformis (strain CCMP3155) TaxID=1169540 RepID=A0A0G4GFK2_VITBC|nr:unnamed protein product [Vitrella brassicaformis CCMP3155]|eukprot:CEM28285.1 unnamed protein product [Vitrella brassicaformis CCMP3155]
MSSRAGARVTDFEEENDSDEQHRPDGPADLAAAGGGDPEDVCTSCERHYMHLKDSVKGSAFSRLNQHPHVTATFTPAPSPSPTSNIDAVNVTIGPFLAGSGSGPNSHSYYVHGVATRTKGTKKAWSFSPSLTYKVKSVLKHGVEKFRFTEEAGRRIIGRKIPHVGGGSVRESNHDDKNGAGNGDEAEEEQRAPAVPVPAARQPDGVTFALSVKKRDKGDGDLVLDVKASAKARRATQPGESVEERKDGWMDAVADEQMGNGDAAASEPAQPPQWHVQGPLPAPGPLVAAPRLSLGSQSHHPQPHPSRLGQEWWERAIDDFEDSSDEGGQGEGEGGDAAEEHAEGIPPPPPTPPPQQQQQHEQAEDAAEMADAPPHTGPLLLPPTSAAAVSLHGPSAPPPPPPLLAAAVRPPVRPPTPRVSAAEDAAMPDATDHQHHGVVFPPLNRQPPDADPSPQEDQPMHNGLEVDRPMDGSRQAPPAAPSSIPASAPPAVAKQEPRVPNRTTNQPSRPPQPPKAAAAAEPAKRERTEEGVKIEPGHHTTEGEKEGPSPPGCVEIPLGDVDHTGLVNSLKRDEKRQLAKDVLQIIRECGFKGSHLSDMSGTTPGDIHERWFRGKPEKLGASGDLSEWLGQLFNTRGGRVWVPVAGPSAQPQPQQGHPKAPSGGGMSQSIDRVGRRPDSMDFCLFAHSRRELDIDPSHSRDCHSQYYSHRPDSRSPWRDDRRPLHRHGYDDRRSPPRRPLSPPHPFRGLQGRQERSFSGEMRYVRRLTLQAQ